MRWEQLFADLEAQFAAHSPDDEELEAASRFRAEYGRLLLTDRLRGARGWPVTLTCRGAGELGGRLVDVGTDWLLLTDATGRELLVATAAVRSVGGLGAATAPPAEVGPVARRLDLRRALRGLARDRAAVQCLLDDGSVLAGTVDRVGADFLELAEHPLDLPRRRDAVTGVRAVVLDAVAAVRTARPVGN
ncbi:hypothetical protein [Modestobacter lapidis]|nr:hypothetical protein [Modestobacter lapidis]